MTRPGGGGTKRLAGFAAEGPGGDDFTSGRLAAASQDDLMGIGDVFGPEERVFQDAVTGVTIRQLTDWRCHSHHLYFTNSGLYDGGRRLLIGSHRNNAGNFYSVELATGALTQLSDFSTDDVPALLTAFINPVRREAYFWLGKELLAMDLATGARRTIFTCPDGYKLGNCSCTADGRTVCVSIQQDLSRELHLDTSHGYIGFPEYWAASPNCRIAAIDLDSGLARVVHEEDCWIGHINTSPTLPDILSFCHEGPWIKVDQRMWILNLATGKVEPLRPQTPGERIGHEYWFADGTRIGYHGSSGDVNLFGYINADGTERVERPFPHGSMHFHSIDEKLIVGDGGKNNPFMLVWRLEGDRYAGPRRLLRHRGSFHIQIVHVHPHVFTEPDGVLRIVYTADHNGYGNVFLVEMPEFESLPEVED